MAGELQGRLSRLLKGARARAADTIGRHAGAYAKGKVAGKTVTDDAGNVLVEAGHLIDGDVISAAERAGKLSAVAAAAAAAQAQDLREKASERYEQTDRGREDWALNTAEAYREARSLIGNIAGIQVTDVRGTVIVAQGKKIEDEDVRAARAVDQLEALIFSARQGGLAPQRAAAPAPDVPERATASGSHPSETGLRRRTLPVIRRPESDRDAGS